MGAKKAKPSQVVVGNTSSGSKIKRKRVGIILMAMLLLVAAGVAVAFYGTDSKKDSGTTAKQPLPSNSKELIKTTNQTRYTNPDEAAAMAEATYDKLEDKAQKHDSAVQTAVIYESNGKYQDAIEWYLKADALDPGKRGAVTGLGRCYEAIGDKQKAIEYYKKAIALEGQVAPGAQNESAYYQYRLDKLTGESKQ